MMPMSDRTLERYLLSELPEDEMDRVARAAGLDPDVASRLEALRRSNAEILERYPPQMMAARIRDRWDAAEKAEQARRQRRWRGLAFALPAAALAAVLTVVLQPLRLESTRLKGLEGSLVLHRKSGAAIEALSDGARASAGDVIQISYAAAGARYGAIFSIDGRGTVTWHLPLGLRPRAESPQVQPGGEVPLGSAYELDEAPGFERFFLVTSDKPFPLDRIDAEAKRLAADPAAARGGSLRLSRGLAQASFLLVKAAGR
jgi:hypothetical protein